MPKEYTLIGGNGTRVSPLEVTESGTYEAGDSRAFNPVKVNVPSGSSTLTGLTDVDISNPANGQTLVYNSTSEKWENGEGGSSTLSGLTDVDISNPANGQTLVYNAASSKWVNGSDGGVLVVNINAEGAFDQTWQTIKDAGFCVFKRHFSEFDGEGDVFSILGALNTSEEGYGVVIMTVAEDIAKGYVGELATTTTASGYPVIVPSN